MLFALQSSVLILASNPQISFKPLLYGAELWVPEPAFLTDAPQM